jgi:hypothetical protein
MENSDISGTIGQLQDITAQMLAGKQSSVAGDELLNNCPPNYAALPKIYSGCKSSIVRQTPTFLPSRGAFLRLHSPFRIHYQQFSKSFTPS